jgi:PAS domain-containing protein
MNIEIFTEVVKDLYKQHKLEEKLRELDLEIFSLYENIERAFQRLLDDLFIDEDKDGNNIFWDWIYGEVGCLENEDDITVDFCREMYNKIKK